uniref:Uncharacterized protein n=1 Tax=Meloidogyne javanica TaxID=6303 RepID=A0A915LF89_MELJA
MGVFRLVEDESEVNCDDWNKESNDGRDEENEFEVNCDGGDDENDDEAVEECKEADKEDDEEEDVEGVAEYELLEALESSSNGLIVSS